MDRYTTHSLDINFKMLKDGEDYKTDIKLHSLNNGDKSGPPDFGNYSYVDCLELTNAWKNLTGRPIKNYYYRNAPSQFSSQSITELADIARLRGREIGKAIATEVSKSENILIVMAPNSMRLWHKKVSREESVSLARKHLSTNMATGAIIFLDVEGYNVESIEHSRLMNLYNQDLNKFERADRIIILDDHVVKGRAFYGTRKSDGVLKPVIEAMISAKFNKYKIDFFVFFALNSGISTLKNKNGWVRYGLRSRGGRGDELFESIKIQKNNSWKNLLKLLPSSELSPKELDYIFDN